MAVNTLSLVVAEKFLNGCFFNHACTVTRPFWGTITLQMQNRSQEDGVTIVGIDERWLENEEELRSLHEVLQLDLVLIYHDAENARTGFSPVEIKTPTARP